MVGACESRGLCLEMSNYKKGIGRMIYGQTVKHSTAMDGAVEAESQDRMYHVQFI